MTHPFPQMYRQLLEAIRVQGMTERNERTSRGITSAYGAQFAIGLHGYRMPMIDLRRVYPRTAAIELAWFLSGSQDVKWLHQYDCHIWDKFVEADGSVASYGARWRTYFGRDQIADAVEELSLDNSSRQVVVCAWDPGEDGMWQAKGLMGTRPKNVPCPTQFTLNLGPDDKLYSTYFLRSSDAYVGLPYDIMNQCMLTAAFCSSLTDRLGRPITPGVVTICAAHIHVYDVHFDLMDEAMGTYDVPEGADSVMIPRFSLQQIVEDPSGYIDMFPKTAGSALVQKPELIV